MGYDKKQWRGEIISIFWSYIGTNCSLRSHHAPFFSPNPPFRKTIMLPPPVWPSNKFTWTVI